MTRRRRRRQAAAPERPFEPLSPGEGRLVAFMLDQTGLREAIDEGSILQVRASGDERQNALFPNAATLEINSADASEALRTIGQVRGDAPLILIHNALQFLIETRQFLGACFGKLAVGGTMIVTVPHQFLHERKWKLPSRRNPLHRRFYTANTLMADIEEAIDPTEFRVRFLADHDEDYDYQAALDSPPDGGQDIVVAIEKLPRPAWRPGLDQDEIWAQPATQPVRYLEVDRAAPAVIRTVAPDSRAVERIALVKLDHRGDFLMAGDAFRIFRDSFPSAEVSLVCGSWNVGEAKKSGLFDHVIPFDFFPEDDSARLESEPREVLVKRFAKQMSGVVYDLAADLRLYDDTREVLRAIRARNRAGFDRYNSFPWLTIRLNLPSATDDDRAEHYVIPAGRFATSQCRHLTYEIRRDIPYRAEEWRTLVWGPYQELKPGNYLLEVLIDPTEEDFEAPFDIVFDKGRQTLLTGALNISKTRRPQIAIEVDRKIDEFEFRMIGAVGHEWKPFRFFGLHLVRSGVTRGVHQAEAMALLAHLTRMRLHDAYTTELA